MGQVSIQGNKALLFNVTKGTLFQGTGALPLTANTWYLINSAITVAPELPFGVGYMFKESNAAGVITPKVGEDVYPLTFTKICKADLSLSTSKGTVDVTDDCQEGYNAYISDGFTEITGSANAFFKQNDPSGDMVSGQLDLIKRFFDVITDSGTGTYVLTPKNDDDLILAILKNSNKIAANDVQIWVLVPVILTGITLDSPLKGVQSFNFNFQKAQGPASVYRRTTNSTETVF